MISRYCTQQFRDLDSVRYRMFDIREGTASCDIASRLACGYTVVSDKSGLRLCSAD